jgi:hypothetical protein
MQRAINLTGFRLFKNSKLVNLLLEWEKVSKEIKELYEQLRCEIYLKTCNE